MTGGKVEISEVDLAEERANQRLVAGVIRRRATTSPPWCKTSKMPPVASNNSSASRKTKGASLSVTTVSSISFCSGLYPVI